MKRITLGRVLAFVGVMTAVAFLVYLPFDRREQRQAQAALQQQRLFENQAMTRAAISTAAAEHAEYVARYLNRGLTRKLGFKMVAIANEFENDEGDRTIADALANHLKGPGIVFYTSFFKSAFYADDIFSDLFTGSREPVEKLDLTNTLDALLLAQEQVQYSTNGPDLDNVITANMKLEVAFLPFDMMRRQHTWTFLANGAGFNLGEARLNAQERLLKQIANDTNMTLLPLPNEDQGSY